MAPTRPKGGQHLSHYLVDLALVMLGLLFLFTCVGLAEMVGALK